MIEKLYLGKYFGVGPIGLFFTTLIWFLLYYIERLLGVPQMEMSTFLRTSLLLIFTIDAVYLLVGSNYYLIKHDHGNSLIKEGPFQHIRHPIYGAVIFSFTGIVAIIAKSLGLFVSVIPIAIMWSWLVQVEENKMIGKFGNEYIEYIEQTGQFLPSWRAMRNSVDEKVL